MRGIATVIFVGFVSVIMLGLVGPAIIEPIVEVFVNDPAVQNSQFNAQGYSDRLMSAIFVWGTLFVLGSGVVSAVVWYFRKERTSTRRVR